MTDAVIHFGEHNRLRSQFVTIKTKRGLKSQNAMSKMGSRNGAVTDCDLFNRWEGTE